MKKISVIFLIGLIVFSFRSAESKDLEKVDVIMNWLPCYEWAVFLLGEKEGFYEEFGIDLNLIPGKGSSVSAKMVATQKVSFGLAGASNVLMSKEKNMPIKAVACLQPNTSVAIFFRKNRGISEPNDLIGKDISSYSQSMKRILLEAFLDRHNIPADKLNLISVAKEAEKSIFINGKVDVVLGLLPTEEIKYREIGLDFDWFLLSDYGVKMMQNSLITNISTIESNPDLVRRLVKATSKSLKYAVKNPVLADRALAEKYPETIRGAFQKAVPFIENDIFDKKGYGYMEIDDWRETQKILLKSGQLKNAQRLSDVYTNEFLN